MRLAIVGITGLVGNVVNDILTNSDMQITEFIPVASERSKGKKVNFRNKSYDILTIDEAVNMKPDVAIFSAGAETSKKWAPLFAEVGTFVVDNSSAWRMDPSIKLVVPEINAFELTENDKIIANPNCSTIQMVMGLAPLHKKYKIKRIVVSTYQSFTGTGNKAVQQFESEKNGEVLRDEDKAYPHQIFANAIPHCDVFLENGYTKEEMKLVNETRKILSEPTLRITATAVRIPVYGGHSESINIEFENEFELSEIINVLNNTDGITVQDDIGKNIYPMPLFAHAKDDVFVGRIRRDESNPKTLNLWIVADNLRKGAATNAVQIVKYLEEKNLIRKSTAIKVD